MFLSMVIAPNDRGAVLSRDTFAQRFNVAASRARDRMYLVRSMEIDQLSAKDILRRGLISHFNHPFAQDEEAAANLRSLCESPFERELYDELIGRGFQVIPQVKVGNYRIDMVIQGSDDERLAIECDGDRYHGADKWADDMQRQRILERVGWVFWRCFASKFVRQKDAVIADLLNTLRERGIEPSSGENTTKSVHCESRRVRISEMDLSVLDNAETTDDLSLTDNEVSAIDIKTIPTDNGKKTIEQKIHTKSDPFPFDDSGQLQFTENNETESKPVIAPQNDKTISPDADVSFSDETFHKFLKDNGLTTEDNRENNGALWVHLGNNNLAPALQLAKWGFHYKAGRGWWRK